VYLSICPSFYLSVFVQAHYRLWCTCVRSCVCVCVSVCVPVCLFTDLNFQSLSTNMNYQSTSVGLPIVTINQSFNTIINQFTQKSANGRISIRKWPHIVPDASNYIQFRKWPHIYYRIRKWLHINDVRVHSIHIGICKWPHIDDMRVRPIYIGIRKWPHIVLDASNYIQFRKWPHIYYRIRQ